MDLNDIRVYYENFDDWKIEKIASEEAGSLRPEVLDILKGEIKKRKLNPNLIDSVNALTKELKESEINEYCEILRNQTCPVCHFTNVKLNATMVGRVVSLVFITNYDKSLKIACSKCLDSMHRKAISATAVLGWWGLPWGPIQTIRSFIFNSRMKKNNWTEEPNEIFESFIRSNIGILERSRTEPELLNELLERTKS